MNIIIQAIVGFFVAFAVSELFTCKNRSQVMLILVAIPVITWIIVPITQTTFGLPGATEFFANTVIHMIDMTFYAYLFFAPLFYQMQKIRILRKNRFLRRDFPQDIFDDRSRFKDRP